MTRRSGAALPSSSSRPTPPKPRPRSRRSSRRPPTASRPTSPPGPDAAWRRSTPPRTHRGPPRPWRSSTARAQGGVADPDDLRILSMVHEAQGTPEARRQAVGDLESLIGRESATPDDRRRLAMLLDAAGKWPQAREQFRQLVLRTEGGRDTETLRLRPLYLALFVEALARHHQPGDDSDLAEARQMVAKLGPLQGAAPGPVLLEAQIDRAAGQLEAATAADPRLRRPARPHHRGSLAPGRRGRADRAARRGRGDLPPHRGRAARRHQRVPAGHLPRPPRPPQGCRRPCETLWAKPATPRERWPPRASASSATPASPPTRCSSSRHRLDERCAAERRGR